MRRFAACALLALSLGSCASGESNRPRFLDEPQRAAMNKPDTGSCRPFFVSPSLWSDDERVAKHSCWHRLWEVPAALVTVPVAIGIFTAPIWLPIILL